MGLASLRAGGRITQPGTRDQREVRTHTGGHLGSIRLIHEHLSQFDSSYLLLIILHLYDYIDWILAVSTQ